MISLSKPFTHSTGWGADESPMYKSPTDRSPMDKNPKDKTPNRQKPQRQKPQETKAPKITAPKAKFLILANINRDFKVLNFCD